MYKNAGKSIKTLVNILVAVGIAICMLVALLAVVVIAAGMGVSGETPVAVVLSVIGIIIVCALVAFFIWLSGLTLYAYGEIAENTAKTVKYQEEQIECMDIIIKQLEDAVFKSETEKTSKD